jgi:hypothetical protein
LQIGNREMYQNCVNVDIEGGSGDGQFPPIFVANLASVNDIETTENSDVLFPEPGEFVTTMSATNGHNYPKATVGAAQGGNQGAPSSYAAPAPTSAPAYSAPGSSAPVVSSAPASSAPAYGNPAYSAPPNVQSGIQSYDGQKGRQTQTTFATAVKTSVAAPSSAAPAPTGYSSGSSNSESNNTSSEDTPSDGVSDGTIRCVDGGLGFEVHDQGKWVSMGRTSAGTKCESGVIQKRSSASRFRRHLHAHKH